VDGDHVTLLDEQAPSQPRIADAVLLRPTLRGWIHVAAFAIVGIAGLLMLALTTASTGHRLLVVVYLLGTLAMFGVSAVYHRGRWTEAELAWWRRLDHSTIFLAIAGAYTPISVAALSDRSVTATLLTVWIGAAVGITLEFAPLQLPRAVFAVVYVVVGWSLLPSIAQLYRGLGALGFALVIAGGIAYTAGAGVYAAKRPDPWPRTFGFHEVFHLLTVVGAGLHLAAIAFTALPRL